MESLAVRWARSPWNPAQVGRKTVERRSLRRSLVMAELVVYILALEYLYYGMEGGPYVRVTLCFMAVAFLSYILVPASPDRISGLYASSFMEQLDTLRNRLGYASIEWLSKTPPSELIENITERLVAHAIAVRELEKENAGVPIEHWGRQKKSLTDSLERLYDAAASFRLVGGGYGPYYAEADRRLSEEKEAA